MIGMEVVTRLSPSCSEALRWQDQCHVPAPNLGGKSCSAGTRQDPAGSWQGSSTCPSSRPLRWFLSHIENWDPASVRSQKCRARSASRAVTARAQHCWGRAEQRGSTGSARAQGQVPAQPLWHPPDTLRARRGGDAAVATWDRAGLPGSNAGSALYLPKSCLHKRRSKPRPAPGGHRAQMPRGRASSRGTRCPGGPHSCQAHQDGLSPPRCHPVPGWG